MPKEQQGTSKERKGEWKPIEKRKDPKSEKRSNAKRGKGDIKREKRERKVMKK